MLMNLNVALAEQAVSVTDEATTATPGGAGDMVSMLLMMVVMVAVFYFLLIRPQRKKDKAVKNMLSNLKVGDRIWTIGGFYGTVAGLKDDTVTLTMGSLQNTVVVKRSAIGGVENVAVENEAAPEI